MSTDLSLSLLPASLRRCLASLVYETLLLGAMVLGVSALFTSLQGLLGSTALFTGLLRLGLLGVVGAYFVYSWVHGGQTAAMRVWYIRLVTVEGRALGWSQALLRFVIASALLVGVPLIVYLGWSKVYGPGSQAAALALTFCALPFLAKFYDKDHCFLHDRLAGTRQVKLPKPVK